MRYILFLFLAIAYKNIFAAAAVADAANASAVLFQTALQTAWEADKVRNQAKSSSNDLVELSSLAKKIKATKDLYLTYKDIKQLTGQVAASMENAERFYKDITEGNLAVSLISKSQVTELIEHFNYVDKWRDGRKGKGRAFVDFDNWLKGQINDYKDLDGNINFTTILYHATDENERFEAKQAPRFFHKELRDYNEQSNEYASIKLMKEADFYDRQAIMIANLVSAATAFKTGKRIFKGLTDPINTYGGAGSYIENPVAVGSDFDGVKTHGLEQFDISDWTNLRDYSEKDLITLSDKSLAFQALARQKRLEALEIMRKTTLIQFDYATRAALEYKFKKAASAEKERIINQLEGKYNSLK